MLVFGKWGKPEYPEKNLAKQSREKPNPKPTYGIEPSPHQWKENAAPTMPFCVSFDLKDIEFVQFFSERTEREREKVGTNYSITAVSVNEGTLQINTTVLNNRPTERIQIVE